jgi:hypothetical protein
MIKIIKKSIFAIITFIVFFAVFTLFLFPYDTLAKYFLNDTINKYNIPINYSSLEASAFGAKINNIDYYYDGKYSIGSVSIKYSPLSIITQSVAISTVDSPINANIRFEKSNIVFRANQPVKGIIEIYPEIEKYAKSGDIKIEGEINPSTMQGKISAILSSLSLVTPVADVTFDQITTDLELNKNRLTITNFKSNGNNNVDIKGAIHINYNALIHSVVNLQGNLNIAGFKKDFTIRGRASNPRIKF